MKRILAAAVLLCFSSTSFALPSAEDVINKVAPLVWSPDQTQAILFTLHHPECAGKIVSYTAAQDYSLAAFINGLKFTKVIPGMDPISNVNSCKFYNPPKRAYAFIDSQGDKLLGKPTADGARAVLAPLIAKGESKVSAEIAALPYVGTILTNWDCGCDAAFETNFQVEVLADKAVADGVAIGKAAQAGNFGKVIELLITKVGDKVACELGSEFIGTGSIPVVSTIVSKACTSVLGTAVGWLKSAAGAISEAIGLTGYQHVPTAEYYQVHWMPFVESGAKVYSFDGAAEFEKWNAPLYNSCFNYFSKSNMADDTAKGECVAERNQFTNESAAAAAALEKEARTKIGAIYDVRTEQWRANYTQSCKVLDPAVSNGPFLTQQCNQNIESAINAGRSVAVDGWKDCRNIFNYTFDFKSCVTAGYNSTYKERDQAVSAIHAMNLAYTSKMLTDSIKNSAIANEAKAKSDAIDPWIAQCPESFKENCIASINVGWKVCEANKALIPYNKGEFAQQDPVAIGKVLAQCDLTYEGLIKLYAKYVDTTNLVKEQEPACKTYKIKGAFGLACQLDLDATTTKCQGGFPKVNKLGSVGQFPVPGDCPKLIKNFYDKWQVDEIAKKNLDLQTAPAIDSCNATELPGCVKDMIYRIDQCKLAIDKQAKNSVFNLLITSPKLPEAIQKLYASAIMCGSNVLKAAQDAKKGKGAEIIVLATYAQQCPMNSPKEQFNIKCRDELLKTIAYCKTAGLAGKRKGIPEQEVNACHDLLTAVISKYKELANPHAIMSTGSLDKPEASPTPKTKPKMMQAPPVMGLGNEPIAPAANSAPTIPKKRSTTKPPPVVDSTPATRAPVPGVDVLAGKCNLLTGGTYQCETDEGLALCESLKRYGKVSSCVKVIK